MDEDDEFGDLYSDVLPPFQSSPPPPSQPSSIDLNLKNHHQLLVVDLPSDQIRACAGDGDKEDDFASGSRVLEGGDVKLPARALDDGGDLMDKDIKFDIEDGNDEIDVMDSDLIIPGGGGEGDDWDSDSEDDLQIVLNDNNHGPMAMERGDDGEDGDPLVIVADGDANQAMEEQEWGEDAADGERKETGEAGKANGGMVIAPKVGYSSHGYHPFHSQFKYVRPGAAPIPAPNTAVPGGAPGQVCPLVNFGPVAGRGRGDWRPSGIKNGPPMQKVFHSGFGAPAWGAGRGFGGGLEFTLPSHKTIFDVNIDSFEEKPWKYPGIDISDFFNFNLNEESWKDYCKQLEQLRLESTMQSKIRVYESGRTEQAYDPDLPPELAAAATGFHDVAAENANIGKSDIGENDLAKGAARMRPALPTGRAIQVEGGYGERLPSVDMRPPRIRDSDAVIEIVCQDSMEDDSSTGNGVLDQPYNNLSREDLRGHATEEDIIPVENEYFDGFPQTYNSRKRELVGRMPFRNAVRENMPKGDGVLPFHPEAPARGHPASTCQTPVYSNGNSGSWHEERCMQGRAQDRSPRTTQGKKFLDYQKEESVESMDCKHSPLLSSPVAEEIAGDSDIDRKTAVFDDPVLPNGNSEIKKESLDIKITNGTFKDGNSLKKQKLSSRVQPLLREHDDAEDSKAARSSENSKARSGSSKDFDSRRDNVDEEVIQDGRGSLMGGIKKHLDDAKSFRRKDVEGRQGVETNRMVAKGGEGPYSQRDLDPSLGNRLHVKNEGFDRRKDRENTDATWHRRDDDPYSRRIRAEDTRKREHGEEMGSKYRSKARESERSVKDEHHSRKQLDNGSYKVPSDKDASSRNRVRDDNLKSRDENTDDYHSKRRKDDEYIRREHDKEEFSHGLRENGDRRKRERDDVVDQRKRDEKPRIRDNSDDHHSVRHKDQSWVLRDRTERQKEREDWHRQKQPHEENLSKRDRDEGRNTSRSGRGTEEKAQVGHARAKDEYKGSDKNHQLKDIVHHSEQLKRRNRMDDDGLSHHRGREDVHVRGNQLINEERRSGQERSSSRNDRAANISDNQRVHERKENTRKNKESEGGDRSTSKRYQEDQSSHVNETGMKGISEPGNDEQGIQLRHSSRKHKEDASSDDEQQDSRRGRSKMERWTSHKERDFSIKGKSSASLKLKEIDENNLCGSSEVIKILDASTMTAVAIGNQHISAEEKDTSEHEMKDGDTKPLDDRHLDTVEKLKKRSERFKLPMPIEKETSTINRTESEAIPSTKSEAPAAGYEIKPERPARKRRWISQ